MRVLFLDFDGVLHAAIGPAPMMKRFVWAPILNEVLRPFPNVALVVHASARDHTDMPCIMAQLGPLGRRIVDGVPRKMDRWFGICRWLSDHPHVTDYRILDDMPQEFPVGLPQLIVCDSRTGISDLAVQKKMAQWLGAE